MRIAQVVPSLERRHGGPSKSVYSLSSALAALGHEVTLLSTDPGSGETRTEGSLRIELFHRGWPDAVCRAPGLLKRLLGLDADIVHHQALWLRTLDYARRSAERRGAGLVLSPRGMMNDWAWTHHPWRKRQAARFLHPGAFAAADGWHATSELESEAIRARGFEEPVCVAPNGVDAPNPGQTAKAAAYWRETLPEIECRPVALFYSRFHPKKRLLELIDLWLEFGPRDWLLLVVGIPEEFTVRQLEDYAIRVRGSGRVRVFDGAGRPAPYAIASLFVLASHSENFGLAIAEALAHGVPAVITDTTPWGALNGNGGGWCVPWARFPQALREATTEGPERLRLRGEAARLWVLDRYSWAAAARLLADFYRQLRA